MPSQFLHVLSAVIQLKDLDSSRLIPYCHQFQGQADCIIQRKVLSSADLIVDVQSFQSLLVESWSSVDVGLVRVPEDQQAFVVQVLGVLDVLWGLVKLRFLELQAHIANPFVFYHLSLEVNSQGAGIQMISFHINRKITTVVGCALIPVLQSHNEEILSGKDALIIHAFYELSLAIDGDDVSFGQDEVQLQCGMKGSVDQFFVIGVGVDQGLSWKVQADQLTLGLKEKLGGSGVEQGGVRDGFQFAADERLDLLLLHYKYNNLRRIEKGGRSKGSQISV